MEVAMRVYVFAGLLAMSAPAFAGPDGLERAILNGDVAAASEAIAAGAEVDAVLDGGVMTPLALAAARGDPDMVRALLALGASPDAAGGLGITPLVAATNSCNAGTDIVSILLAGGARTDLRAPGGMSPLLVAAQKGRTEMVNLLVAAGADAKAVDVFGDGVLNYAIYAQSPEDVQVALAAGSGTEQLDLLFETYGYRAAVWPGLPRCNDTP
jgi:uncharacterized protein